MNQPRKPLFKVERTESESFSTTHQDSSDVTLSDILIPTKKEPSCKSKSEKVRTKAQPKYMCALCDKNCRSKVNYERHLRKHNKHEFQCPICKVICENKPQLAYHMRDNHMISCHECFKIFSTHEEYKTHLSSHFAMKFLIEFIKAMCRASIIRAKLARKATLFNDRRQKKMRAMIQRSKLLHKHQQVREFNRCDESTDNDE